MDNKHFGKLEDLAPLYIVNGNYVLRAEDAQKVVDKLLNRQLQLEDEIKHYKFLLQNPLPRIRSVK